MGEGILACRSREVQSITLGDAGEEQDVVEIVHPRVGSFRRDLGAGVQFLGDLVVDAEHDHLAARAKLHTVNIDRVRDLFEQFERAGFCSPEFEIDRGKWLVKVGQFDLASLWRRDDPGTRDLRPFRQLAREALPTLSKAGAD